MKHIKRYSALIYLLVIGSGSKAVSNMMGIIKFPNNAALKNPPRVYCAGRILPTEVDEKVKEISFTFPCKSTQNSFFLVVTERIQPVFDHRNPNTVLYLKVPHNNVYKAYHLQLVPVEREEGKGTHVEWHVAPTHLADDNRLPDSAIIVLFPPEDIVALQGGTSFALPILAVKSQGVGPDCEPDKDASTKLLLSSLDMDTLHTVVPRHVKYIEDKGRTIIMPTM